MSGKPRVFIYGASGYTGKLVAESLAQRGIPFVFAGRNRERLEAGLKIVEERFGGPVVAEIGVAGNTLEDLLPLLQDIDVVINVAGPFMQIAWPVVEAALQASCHYLDTTGEQDWTLAIRKKYGQAFADKGLLLNPANSYMWAAGALAAEVVLENDGVDSLDLVYQIDHGLPSEASTKSFLRMICNEQYYLELNELKLWPHDIIAQVALPHRGRLLRALPDEGTYRLREIQLEEDGYVALQGEVKSHGDADSIASALRDQHFQVPLPRSTQVSDQVVTVSITATTSPPRTPSTEETSL